MMTQQRADRLLVERGYFESRAKAQAAIEAGLVTAGGRPVRRASDRLAVDAAIAAQAPHPWVSRGGVKLEAGLDAFGIDPADRLCLDLGASTGGFTQVLLARGAARVIAVDVGRGQLHPSLAADRRVASYEGVDARALDGSLVPEPVDLLVCDLSFISLKLVLPPALPFLRPGGSLVALVKPQFEVGRAGLAKGGLVKDEAARRRAAEEIADLLQASGLQLLGLIPSPIAGGDGNQEFLIGARRG